MNYCQNVSHIIIINSVKHIMMRASRSRLSAYYNKLSKKIVWNDDRRVLDNVKILYYVGEKVRER